MILFSMAYKELEAFTQWLKEETNVPVHQQEGYRAGQCSFGPLSYLPSLLSL